MMKKQLLKLLIVFIFLITATACGKGAKSMGDFILSKEPTNFVRLEMVSGQQLIIELYPDVAPITVVNFKKLVAAKFYDGLIFHRVINNFMIQTGDPLGNGTGGSVQTIKGEFTSNGVTNNLSHTRGIVSMARKGNDNNSASSQFFICQANVPNLDGSYAAFGKVIVGLEIVDQIAQVKTDENDKPLIPQKIKTIVFVKAK